MRHRLLEGQRKQGNGPVRVDFEADLPKADQSISEDMPQEGLGTR